MTLPSEAANLAGQAAQHAAHNGDMLSTVIGILGIVGTLVGVVLTYLIRNRKLTIDYNSGLRSEFIAEMHVIRDELKGSREELRSLRNENDDLRSEVRKMRDENEMLRDEVRGLHGVIDGLRRQSLQTTLSAQTDVIRTFPPNAIPPQTLKAMERMEGHPVIDVAMDELRRRPAPPADDMEP